MVIRRMEEKEENGVAVAATTTAGSQCHVRALRARQVCPHLLYGCLIAAVEGSSSILLRDSSLKILHAFKSDSGGVISDLCFMSQHEDAMTNKQYNLINEIIVSCSECGDIMVMIA